MKKTISIIGGDLRIVYLAQIFANENYEVFTYGLEKIEILKKIKNIYLCENIEDCIKNSKLIISSIPLLQDEEYIKAPFSNRKISFNEFINKLNNKFLIAGKLPEKIKNIDNIETIDLLESEELAILNAISTAEGAIQIAMEKTNFCISDSNILILGFGRIGKVLAKKLQRNWC